MESIGANFKSGGFDRPRLATGDDFTTVGLLPAETGETVSDDEGGLAFALTGRAITGRVGEPGLLLGFTCLGDVGCALLVTNTGKQHQKEESRKKYKYRSHTTIIGVSSMKEPRFGHRYSLLVYRSPFLQKDPHVGEFTFHNASRDVLGIEACHR